ncbi:glutamate-5-semialdehyde dehydrogenase [Canibacter zhoujuaniae]|uniref:glutamate-5-semialdehyde dehydrogenase n=1 Tax=Canibacter zhoujuaniae TaxID=2708343 RepID=UPI00141DAF36|nr:glutamate-5-semialdehyde dehydrogenase [Canibacter zhoujuaniae]
MCEEAIYQKLSAGREAAKKFATASTNSKNEALKNIALGLRKHTDEIIAANQKDLARAKDNGMAQSIQDRLMLNAERVTALSDAIAEVISLRDPIGEIVRGSTLPNGLRLTQVRVPFGVIGAIYEARPNVTVDIASLAIKSGNAVVLRGGSAAEETNAVLIDIIQDALEISGFPRAAVQTVDEFGRAGATAMMRARGYIDVLIPRGSANLIETVVREAKVPVIETGAGVVHIYIDKSANLETVPAIVENAKVQRPGVCNAVDTVLVHEQVAPEVIAAIESRIADRVELLGDAAAVALGSTVSAADDSIWGTEHLALRLGIRVVSDVDEAIAHIDRYSTRHTEVVLAEDYSVVEKFIAEVDAASVIVNASSRFTDGGVFGFGAEVGISTQKLHARGPMGITELTSTKWITRGNGDIRH